MRYKYAFLDRKNKGERDDELQYIYIITLISQSRHRVVQEDNSKPQPTKHPSSHGRSPRSQLLNEERYMGKLYSDWGAPLDRRAFHERGKHVLQDKLATFATLLPEPFSPQYNNVGHACVQRTFWISDTVRRSLRMVGTLSSFIVASMLEVMWCTIPSFNCVLALSSRCDWLDLSWWEEHHINIPRRCLAALRRIEESDWYCLSGSMLQLHYRRRNAAWKAHACEIHNLEMLPLL